jgi:hypothetical protein
VDKLSVHPPCVEVTVHLPDRTNSQTRERGEAEGAAESGNSA